MNRIIGFVKNWTLPLAIAIGTAGFPVFGNLAFLLPYLIFTMLLFTFCRLPFSSIRFNAMHLSLLACQLGGSLLAWLLLTPVNPLLAEAVIVLFITPTGTAAAVITRKLGGSAASITSFTILSNQAAAIAAPFSSPSSIRQKTTSVSCPPFSPSAKKSSLSLSCRFFLPCSCAASPRHSMKNWAIGRNAPFTCGAPPSSSPLQKPSTPWFTIRITASQPPSWD
ncbi:MAG: hypothetical protein NC112_02165 [Oxalobacter formigenes]|nr:hypothetical protein [Oxalobacter formigenes]